MLPAYGVFVSAHYPEDDNISSSVFYVSCVRMA